MPDRLDNDLIPLLRIRAETQLIRAMRAPLPKRQKAIQDSLVKMDWRGNEDLVCKSLAEVIRTLEALHDRRGSRHFASQVRPYCESWLGPYCRACPVAARRI